MNQKFWRNKRVFITGHTGFKGGWLSLWLQSLGANLTGYSLKAPTKPNLYTVAKVSEEMSSIEGDVRHYNSLAKAIKTASPEIIIHMAAQALVHESYKSPLTTYETNLMGTINLMEVVRSTPSVRAIVIVTTDKCYENHDWVWGYRENEPMGGYDPYSSSKACVELAVAAYRSSFFNPKEHKKHGVGIATARAGNVIGGGDWSQDRLIPDIFRSFEEGDPAIIRNPKSIRPWQFVLEPLRGYLMLAENLFKKGSLFAEAWNFGPKDEDAKTVSWITDQISALWGGGVSWVIGTEPQLHESHFLKLDCSKANSKLGWQPCINLKDALFNTVDWHRAYLDKRSNMKHKTLDQISKYESKVFK